MSLYQTGVKILTSLIGRSFIDVDNGGPVNTRIQMVGGTFICDGTNAVTVADANVDAGSNILISLKTPGGTVGAIPAVQSITAGTGFTVAGTASDQSTYNYLILG